MRWRSLAVASGREKTEKGEAREGRVGGGDGLGGRVGGKRKEIGGKRGIWSRLLRRLTASRGEERPGSGQASGEEAAAFSAVTHPSRTAFASLQLPLPAMGPSSSSHPPLPLTPAARTSSPDTRLVSSNSTLVYYVCPSRGAEARSPYHDLPPLTKARPPWDPCPIRTAARRLSYDLS